MTANNEELKLLISDIRSRTRKLRKERQSCYVCGNHIAITELHHLISVVDIAKYFLRTEDTTHPMPVVWLCPNHHAYWHLLETSQRSMRRLLLSALGDESSKFLELQEKRLAILSQFHQVDISDVE